MSNPFSSEHLACIRDDAHHLVERTRDHQDQLDGLVRTAIAHTGNASIPAQHERWFVAVLPKPSPPKVVLAAVQNAASV